MSGLLYQGGNMILGVGIDIVHIDRMKRWKNIPGIFERFFHADEIREAESRGPAEVMSLAARFAAKEAFGKALGTGLRSIYLKDIHVMNNIRGKPGIVTYGSARQAMMRVGGRTVHISLSHDHESAVAVAVIEG